MCFSMLQMVFLNKSFCRVLKARIKLEGAKLEGSKDGKGLHQSIAAEVKGKGMF